MIWWTYSLVTLKEKERDLILKGLQHEAQLAKWDCMHVIVESDQPIDSTLVSTFLKKHFSHLVVTMPKDTSLYKLNEFVRKIEVQPDPVYVTQIKRSYTRKIRGYMYEAGVFFILLGWGVFFLYRFFLQRLAFNRLQTNFLLAITHELKTPVASVKLGLQTLIRREMDREKQLQVLNQAVGDTDRLTELIDNVLMSTQMEGKMYRLNLEPLNWSELLENHLVKLMGMDHGNHQFLVKIQPNVRVLGDALALGIVIDNLVANSMKYSPDHTTIRVNLNIADGWADLQVSDEGPIIPENERELIFEKFYRIGHENTRTKKGTGLGLYLVKQVVNRHEGQVYVSPRVPSGNQFTVSLKTLS